MLAPRHWLDKAEEGGEVPEYVLEIVEGPEAGRRISLDGALELGRDPGSNGALLQDELISRRHARVTPVEDGARVEDLESRNGTFVDGDQIFDPAHLAPGGQLLVGVTLFELRPAAEAAAGMTSVRPIPASLTQFRALPTQDLGMTSVRTVPTLAKEESQPDYVPEDVFESSGNTGALLPLLDTHTKGKARGAPIGLFVLVALAVILYLALR
ncbi:MAG: FHA domain-containing protein [Actinomycetota bacterium]